MIASVTVPNSSRPSFAIHVNIDLDNGLSPEQRQASIQSRAETSITFQNI